MLWFQIVELGEMSLISQYNFKNILFEQLERGPIEGQVSCSVKYDIGGQYVFQHKQTMDK